MTEDALKSGTFQINNIQGDSDLKKKNAQLTWINYQMSDKEFMSIEVSEAATRVNCIIGKDLISLLEF